MKIVKQLRRPRNTFSFLPQSRADSVLGQRMWLFKALHTVRVLCALIKPELKNKQKVIYRYQIGEL